MNWAGWQQACRTWIRGCSGRMFGTQLGRSVCTLWPRASLPELSPSQMQTPEASLPQVIVARSLHAAPSAQLQWTALCTCASIHPCRVAEVHMFAHSSLVLLLLSPLLQQASVSFLSLNLPLVSKGREIYGRYRVPTWRNSRLNKSSNSRELSRISRVIPSLYSGRFQTILDLKSELLCFWIMTRDTRHEKWSFWDWITAVTYHNGFVFNFFSNFLFEIDVFTYFR